MTIVRPHDSAHGARLARGALTTPVALTYALVLVTTTCVLQVVGPHTANELLLARSTNLYQLARNPIRVLLASAFWVSEPEDLVFAAAALLLAVAPVERRIGSLRTVVVLAVGHVGATLLTAGGLWLALRADVVGRDVVHARDVGPSYALVATAGFLVFLLERRLRAVYAAALVGAAVALVVVSGSFTDFGHLLAILCGFACYPLARHRMSTRPPIGQGLALGRSFVRPADVTGRSRRRS
jgi:hypothetical protein